MEETLRSLGLDRAVRKWVLVDFGRPIYNGAVWCYSKNQLEQIQVLVLEQMEDEVRWAIVIGRMYLSGSVIINWANDR